MKNKRVLFLFEQFCDGNPALARSDNFRNILGSFRNYDETAIVKCIHFDSLFINEKTHVDFMLEATVADFKPDLIVVSFLGNSHMNPSPAILRKLKGNGYNICIMWPDGGYPWIGHKLSQLEGAYSLNVFWAGEHVPGYDGIWLWTAEDTTLFYPDTQVYGAGFIGSLRGYKDRAEYLTYAINQKVEVSITGGTREHGLPEQEYARFIRQHKINLNFPESPSGKDQIKGRVLQSIASRTLLLERDNAVTSKYFVPYKEYMPFESPEDLCGKIGYYLENEDERLEIAENGYQRFLKDYSPKAFWSRIFYEIYAQQHAKDILALTFDPFSLPNSLL